ncbi:MAG: permease [Planctomycetes bacterium]|nr:permease [Planctomycetota bacterium]
MGNRAKETIKLLAIAAVFLAFYFLPEDWLSFGGPLAQALGLAKWYAREHVLLCLVPAFFIAGAIGAFVSQASVMKYLGPDANKGVAYGVASVSGTILAVCSCTVLPLFAGIYRMGAGLGPAITFLYSGPAISVLAIIFTARILGMEMGLARVIGAVSFSVLIGLAMHIIFRRSAAQNAQSATANLPGDQPARPLWKSAAFLAGMIGVLIFANWSITGEYHGLIRCCPTGAVASQFTGKIVERTDTQVIVRDAKGQTQVYDQALVESVAPAEGPVYMAIHKARFFIAGIFLLATLAMLRSWFSRPEAAEWVGLTWGFAKQILPLLLLGVLAAGFFFGQPGGEGLIPPEYVQMLLGEKPDAFLMSAGLSGSLWEGPLRAAWPVLTNIFAAVFAALMYFATLTEVPILQGLMAAGMGKGPALAMLLAGPAVSLPSMLVIASVIGVRKTAVYISLVVGVSTAAGLIYGWLF